MKSLCKGFVVAAVLTSVVGLANAQYYQFGRECRSLPHVDAGKKWKKLGTVIGWSKDVMILAAESKNWQLRIRVGPFREDKNITGTGAFTLTCPLTCGLWARSRSGYDFKICLITKAKFD